MLLVIYCSGHTEGKEMKDDGTAAVEQKTISGSKGFGKQQNMSIFTSCQRETGRRSTAESRDSLITTTFTVVIK